MSVSRPSPVGAQLILRIDSLFEATLAGSLLVVAVRNPRTGVWRLPSDLASYAVAGLAVVLLAVAVVLWRLSGRPTRRLLVMLSTANGATSLAAWWYAFAVNAGGAVRAVAASGGLALIVLAVAQATISARPPLADHVGGSPVG